MCCLVSSEDPATGDIQRWSWKCQQCYKEWGSDQIISRCCSLALYYISDVFLFWLFSNKSIYSAKNKLCVLKASRRYVSVLSFPLRKESQNCPFSELVPGSQQDPRRAGSPALPPCTTSCGETLGSGNSRAGSSLCPAAAWQGAWTSLLTTSYFSFLICKIGE